jgi:alkyldihydroxyacetonephosphate synthase
MNKGCSAGKKLKKAGAGAIVAHGGTISHHHGVGSDHKDYLNAEKGNLGIAAIASLCNQFDPKGQMNPGKLLPDMKD